MIQTATPAKTIQIRTACPNLNRKRPGENVAKRGLNLERSPNEAGAIDVSSSTSLDLDHFGRISMLPSSSLPIQAKLSINASGDQYEQEADRVADEVMRRSAPKVQRKCAKCDEDEGQLIQTKSLRTTGGGMAPQSLTSEIQNSQGKGRNMDANTRAFMESSFGVNFGNVRIHSDQQAAQMNQELSANAFTLGNDIFFNQGQYHPSSNSGMKLLAHELTHVLQQNRAVGGNTIQRSVSKNYSRGNDDSRECNYETAQVFATLDTSRENFSCDSPFSFRIDYHTVLAGNPRDLQPVTIGPRFRLVEEGNTSNTSANLRHTANDPPAGPPGDFLDASIDLTTDISCNGETKAGRILLQAGSTVQQELNWAISGDASGISEEYIDVIQRVIRQPMPLLAMPTKYPDFPGQPRNAGNCCNSTTGLEEACSTSTPTTTEEVAD